MILDTRELTPTLRLPKFSRKEGEENEKKKKKKEKEGTYLGDKALKIIVYIIDWELSPTWGL